MTTTPPPSGPVAAALPIIERWAQTGRTFSANDCRHEFDTAQIPNSRRGPAFGYARLAGIVVPVGLATSSGRSAHAKPVVLYRGADWMQPAFDQPRDDRGRFDQPIPAGQMTLEEAS